MPVQIEEILGNLTKNRIISYVKIILTKIGLKPIILLIIHSNLCRNYLFPILINVIKLPLRLKYYKLIRINKFFVFFLINLQYSFDISTAIVFLPNSKATLLVVPEPAKGSKTVSFL